MIHIDWFWFAVIASVGFSLQNIFQKIALKEKYDTVAFSMYFQFLVGLFAFPMAIYNYEPAHLKVPVLLASIICFTGYALVNVLFYYGLKKVEVSQVKIMASTSSFWMFLGGLIFLKEALDINKIFGVFLVMLGIVFLSLKKTQIFSFSKYHLFIMGYALAAGFLGVLDKYLIGFYNIYAYQVLNFISCSIITAIIFPKSIKNVKEFLTIKKSNFYIMIAAFLGSIGCISYFISLKTGGEISQVGPILQSSMILTVLIGIIFLNEKERLIQKLISAVLMFVGVVLLR